MRFFDRLLGVPACFILTMLRRIVQLAPSSEREAPKKVLFIKLAEQGSTVLAYKALKLAAERYGRENVYFMVFEENRFILDMLDVVPEENVIAIKTDHLWDVMMGALEAIGRARKEGIEATIDMEFFARSTAVLSFLTGARIRVGYHGFHGEGPYRGDLMTHRLFFNHHLHTTDAFQLLVEAVAQPETRMPVFESDLRLSFGRMDYDGLVKTRYVMEPRDEDYPRVESSVDDRHRVMDIMRKAGGDGVERSRIVLLNANCSDIIPLRRWPEENYLELAGRLLDAHDDVYIALTGGPEEAAGAGALVKKIDRERCFSMAGRTTMRDLLTLYELATVMVTNDSGPAHFASLTSIETVVLFGPETPELFGSRSSRSHILWAATPFTPCVNALNNREAPSANDDCMRLIPVDDVYRTVESILERHPRRAKGAPGGPVAKEAAKEVV